MKARNCIILVLCFCYTCQALAQKTGKITGTVSEKGIPLEFVTITLARTVDTSKVVHFTTSDSTGYFALDSIASGEYQLRSSLMGYKPAIKSVTISGEHNEISSENITLDKDEQYLQSV